MIKLIDKVMTQRYSVFPINGELEFKLIKGRTELEAAELIQQTLGFSKSDPGSHHSNGYQLRPLGRRDGLMSD